LKGNAEERRDLAKRRGNMPYTDSAVVGRFLKEKATSPSGFGVQQP
jgi:hypothetical protein